MPTRTIPLPHPVCLRTTLGPLANGRGDPTIRIGAGAVVRAFHTPEGPTTLWLRQTADRIEAEAWGAGADWALDRAPAQAGCLDDAAGFDPDHPAVARAHRLRPGLRVARTGQVSDALVPTILAQKVTGIEAKRAWAGMCRDWGSSAPGPFDLLLPPTSAVLASTPYWAFHRYGVERRRAEVIRGACARIDRLQEAVTMPREDAWRRLTALPGLGPWTAAIVMRHAMGDPDTVEVGDFHCKNTVAWHLAGEARGSDERMVELLDPFTGHRGRVIMLLESALGFAPRRGPRMAPGRVARL